MVLLYTTYLYRWLHYVRRPVPGYLPPIPVRSFGLLPAFVLHVYYAFAPAFTLPRCGYALPYLTLRYGLRLRSLRVPVRLYGWLPVVGFWIATPYLSTVGYIYIYGSWLLPVRCSLRSTTLVVRLPPLHTRATVAVTRAARLPTLHAFVTARVRLFIRLPAFGLPFRCRLDYTHTLPHLRYARFGCTVVADFARLGSWFCCLRVTPHTAHC